MIRRLPETILTTALLLSAAQAAEPAPEPAQIEFFEQKIRPVLVEYCFECHSTQAETVEGGLLLDNRASIARGGESGAVVIKGDPDRSRLIIALTHADGSLQMPPEKKLPEAVIRDFQRWVKMGAPDPRDGAVPVTGLQIATRAASHWAFSPPVLPPVPAVRQMDRVQTDLDRFIVARLEREEIRPSGRADPRTLVRRLFFDLTGLPPAYHDVRKFEMSPTDAAWETLVDRLLNSEQYGERWARHWLDLARFSDTRGYVFQKDRNYPNAYRYRDWVIHALNQDRPYDEFLKLQIAADSLVTGDDKTDLAAMGFLTLGRRFINNINDIIDDRIDVVFRGTMGLTVTCARCHNHKYDPISTEDYYSLYGVFWSSREQQDDDLPLRLVDKPKPTDVQIFIRGNHRNRGATAPRRFPVFFAGSEGRRYTQGSGRLQMAERITDPKNPLTARVLVNRVWSHLTGQGLVATPSDFGLRSTEPVQRDVLDYLAVTFIEDGWSLKKLIRRIVLSGTYRQGSDTRESAVVKDPENRLLWRAERRRLNFEAMRDALLAVSGSLDRKIGGPSEKIETLPPTKRRTLYAFIDRQNLPGLFRTFDFASPDTHSPSRPETTVPQQALFLMNNGFVHAVTEPLVARLDVDARVDDRIRSLYQTVLARDPVDEEITLGRRFVSDSTVQTGGIRSRWQFGYGSLRDDSSVQFTLLPHFDGNAWQGGPRRPDPKLGWVTLNAAGGHPGNDLQHMVIRRWVSPADGVIQVSGTARHPSDKGDGVQCRVTAGRAGEAGRWVVRNKQVTTRVTALEVRAGDTVDFLTDCRTNPNYDTFEWKVTVQFTRTSNRNLSRAWDSRQDFHGPLPEPLTRWQQYAQTLLLTNEFLFLD